MFCLKCCLGPVVSNGHLTFFRGLVVFNFFFFKFCVVCCSVLGCAQFMFDMMSDSSCAQVMVKMLSGSSFTQCFFDSLLESSCVQFVFEDASGSVHAFILHFVRALLCPILI